MADTSVVAIPVTERRLANLGPPRPENMVPANRVLHGAFSVDTGRPIPPWLPWASDAEAAVVAYLEALPAQAGCAHCAALASAAARAYGAVFCVEAYARENALPFCGKNGVRKVFTDLAVWEDRLLTRLERMEKHRRESHDKPSDPVESLRRLTMQAVSMAVEHGG